MKKYFLFLLLFNIKICFSSYANLASTVDTFRIDFFSNEYIFHINKDSIRVAFSELRNTKNNHGGIPTNLLESSVNKINLLQKELKLGDWLVYQLIRRVAEKINSKYENYTDYTITKYALLSALGYEPLIYTSDKKILLYIKSTDTVYNLPIKNINGVQYICLNYHDYQYQINFQIEKFYRQFDFIKNEGKNFTYTLSYLPSFKRNSYVEKKISFVYKNNEEIFKVLVNKDMQDYFTNYPVTEYRYQFNIPFSEITYQTLIPDLKARIQEFSISKGIEYIMFFVRDGFEFETDTKLFGREKRLSAEETLISNSSDCEDRSALFFSLVKELYQLPMAILSYPEHVNVAVALPVKKKNTIQINNLFYTICEPTPQKRKRGIGWIPRTIKNQPYEIAYTFEHK